VADEDRPGKTKLANQRGHIGAEILDRALSRRAGGGTVTAQVARHDFVIP
jgi:hypothetical protein